MKTNLTAMFVGLLFALGLGVSGMTRPEKVVGFLDIFGRWDPSLLFVMAGAVAVSSVATVFILKRETPLFSINWHLPIKKEITLSLIFGSFIFGVGWAVGGFCPGPALVSLASFKYRPFLFFASLILGMLLFRVIDRRLEIKR